MPQVSHAAVVDRPPAEIWDFVKDMDRWGPLLTGYQGHEQRDDKVSVWTLKGDVGVLSRRVQLEVCIDEWVEQERVSFTLKGLNEPVSGGGRFELSAAGGAASAPAEPAPTPRRSPLQRFLRWLFALLFRRAHGTVERSLPAAPSATASELRFTLEMEAGGPTGPLVNAMLEPALQPAAEDLANKIAARLEAAGAPSPTPEAQTP